MPVFPFSEEGKFAYEAEWRGLFSHLGDGVVGDLTGGALKVTAAGDGRVVRVAPTPAGAVAKVQGFGYTTPSPTVPVSLSLSTVGVQPTGTQQRTDVAVMRLDMAAKNIAPIIVAGAPGAAPARPALQSDPAGVFDLPLASWTVGTAAITQSMVKDERTWLGPRQLLSAAAALPALAMLGSLARWRGVDYRRELNAQGNPAWVPDGAWQDYVPQWVSSSGATSVGAGGQLVGRWCRVARVVHWQLRWLLGSPSAGGAPDSTWRFTLPTPAATPNVFMNNIGHVGMKNRGIWLAALAHRHSAIPDAFTVIAHNQAQAIGPTNPNTLGWLAGDEMRINGTYETEI